MPDPNLPPETDTDPKDPQPPSQPVSEPADPQTPPNDPPADPAPQIDYEKKFKESAREAQILADKLKAYEQNPLRKELTTEPTDLELQAAFPEWDVMTETEKKLARQSFGATRLANSLLTEREQEKAEKRWMTDLELTIAQNPSLQGKEQAFKEFAKKPTHRGAPLQTLVSAFLFESSSNPSPAPNPTPQPGLLPGNGGPRVPEKPKLLSAAELKTLRETNDKAYREYIATHDVSQMLEE